MVGEAHLSWRRDVSMLFRALLRVKVLAETGHLPTLLKFRRLLLDNDLTKALFEGLVTLTVRGRNIGRRRCDSAAVGFWALPLKGHHASKRAVSCLR